MKMVYLAGRYRCRINNPILRKIFYLPCIIKNIIVARKYARILWNLGYIVFSPHSNSGLFPEIGWPRVDEKMLMEGSLKFIDKVDMVIFMPDWESSVGAVIEFNYAKNKGILAVEYDKLMENI